MNEFFEFVYLNALTQFELTKITGAYRLTVRKDKYSKTACVESSKHIIPMFETMVKELKDAISANNKRNPERLGNCN